MSVHFCKTIALKSVLTQLGVMSVDVEKDISYIVMEGLVSVSNTFDAYT